MPDRQLARYETLDEALNQACTLLAGGMAGVRISDIAGNRIDGTALEACCRGEKTLGDDLQAN